MPGAARSAVKPGNPLWIQWLREWETRLADNPEKNERIIKAIKKARRSIELNPIPIDHPANASHLKFVGEKTIKHLTQRQQEYCDQKGISMPIPTTVTFEQAAAKLNRKSKRKQSGDTPTHASQNARSDDNDNDDHSEVGIDTLPTKEPLNSRAYQPRLRSGAFAILIGMACHGANSSPTETMIVERGDPFYKQDGDSLTDQDKNTGGAGHWGFSGWSAMNSTLIKRNLVIKSGRNPIKYTLTHGGWKIARAAVRHAKKFTAFDYNAREDLPVFPEADISDSEEEEHSSVVEHVQRTGPAKKVQRRSTSQDVASLPTAARPIAALFSADDDKTGPFLFYYLDNQKQRVKQRDQAEIFMDDKTFTPLYLIEFRNCQQQHVITRSLQGLQSSKDSARYVNPDTCTARMPAHLAPGTASGFGDAKASFLASASRSLTDEAPHKFTIASQGSVITLASKIIEPAPKPASNASVKDNLISSRSDALILLDSDSEPEPRDSDKFRSGILRAAHITEPASRLVPLHNAPRIVDSASALSMPSASASAPLKIAVDRLMILTPDAYDIVMLLDMREEAGLGKGKNGDRLDQLLTKRGVKWESRNLSMGDVIWVARSRTDDTEVVLDCCLERKRLDDLISSLKDGRYMEQKNRMKRSGISRLIYLVEESEGKATADFYEDHIWTIKSSMQVVEDFSVHVVKSPKHVCFYLAALTSVLAETYRYTHLRVLPDDGLTVQNFRPTLDSLRQTWPAVPFFIKYDTYARLHSKVHTIATSWAKIADVASIEGMSLERAERFVNRFSTPIEFFAQLEIAETQDAIENANQGSARLKKGAYGDCWIMRQTAGVDDGHAAVRPIGQALSTKVWDLFTATAYAAKS